MMGSAGFHVEHRVVVEADASAVYGLVADVSQWPVIFDPTVHTRVLERSADGDRFEIWATVNGEVRNWASRRIFDPVDRRIEFGQERSAPPVGYMGGSWRFVPLTKGRTEVVLSHDYSPVPGQPGAADLIARILEHNSVAELEALRVIAALGVEIDSVLFTFKDTVELTGAASEAGDFIWAADLWPERLPHVVAMNLVGLGNEVQDMTMDTRAPDGSVHTTRSIRVRLADQSIAYKQISTPRPLLGHSGVWEFVTGPAGATMCARHTVLIDPSAVADLFGPEVGIVEAASRVRAALGGNSRTTMEHAARHAASAEVAR
jgi:aromatase